MTLKRCGYVALLGQPNAGKSTLMNACLGTKLAVVSAKPQTTRNKILGICATGDSQVLFLDTPGIHKTFGLPKLNQKMNATAWSVLQDADLVCYLVDASAGWRDEDEAFYSQIVRQSEKPVVVVATKTDKLKAEIIDANLDVITQRMQACLNVAEGDNSAQQKRLIECYWMRHWLFRLSVPPMFKNSESLFLSGCLKGRGFTPKMI